MYKILQVARLGPNTYQFDIRVPLVAKKAQPGQFVILRLDEHGERIPLTLCDWDLEKGSITIVVQTVGKTSSQMAKFTQGQDIMDVVGPLGNPTELVSLEGRVVLVGGGTGIAALYPIARAHTEIGNHTVSILGARSEDQLILLDEVAKVSSEVIPVTNDGSVGSRGWVTDVLDAVIRSEDAVNRVIAIGPMLMMKAVAELTRPFHIPTYASLNPIMIDGTGMCGACRVTVGGEIKFACVDGPEFDAHEVDFDGAINRMKTYSSEEKEASDRFKNNVETPCKLN